MRRPTPMIHFILALTLAASLPGMAMAKAAKAKPVDPLIKASRQYFSCYAYYNLATTCLVKMGKMDEDGYAASEVAKTALLQGGQALLQKQSPRPPEQLEADAAKAINAAQDEMQDSVDNCDVDDLNTLIEEKSATCEKLATQASATLPPGAIQVPAKAPVTDTPAADMPAE